MARPVVVLPQPDSPTRLKVSPALHSEADAVDRPHPPDGAPQEPGPDGKMNLQVVDDEQRRRRHRAPLDRHRMRGAAGAATASRPPPRNGRPALCASPTGRKRGILRRAARRGRGRSAQRGWNGQPGGRSRRRRRLAGDRIEPRVGGVDPRHALQQRHRVGMARMPEDLLDRPGLDDAAAIHDGDAMGDFGDDAEIVGDQDHRRAGLGLAPRQHRQAPAPAR